MFSERRVKFSSLTGFAKIGFEYQNCPGYKSKKETDVDIIVATILRIGLS